LENSKRDEVMLARSRNARACGEVNSRTRHALPRVIGFSPARGDRMALVLQHQLADQRMF